MDSATDKVPSDTFVFGDFDECSSEDKDLINRLLNSSSDASVLGSKISVFSQSKPDTQTVAGQPLLAPSPAFDGQQSHMGHLYGPATNVGNSMMYASKESLDFYYSHSLVSTPPPDAAQSKIAPPTSSTGASTCGSAGYSIDHYLTDADTFQASNFGPYMEPPPPLAGTPCVYINNVTGNVNLNPPPGPPAAVAAGPAASVVSSGVPTPLINPLTNGHAGAVPGFAPPLISPHRPVIVPAGQAAQYGRFVAPVLANGTDFSYPHQPISLLFCSPYQHTPQQHAIFRAAPVPPMPANALSTSPTKSSFATKSPTGRHQKSGVATCPKAYQPSADAVYARHPGPQMMLFTRPPPSVAPVRGPPVHWTATQPPPTVAARSFETASQAPLLGSAPSSRKTSLSSDVGEVDKHSSVIGAKMNDVAPATDSDHSATPSADVVSKTGATEPVVIGDARLAQVESDLSRLHVSTTGDSKADAIQQSTDFEVADTVAESLANDDDIDVTSSSAKSWASLFQQNEHSTPGSGNRNSDSRQLSGDDVDAQMGIQPVSSQISSSSSSKPTARITPYAVDGVQAPNSRREMADQQSWSADKQASLSAFGNYLSDFILIHRTASNFHPHGLVNRSNWCFVNAVLQALSACPPFINVLTSIGANLSILDGAESAMPVTMAMVEYAEAYRIAVGSASGDSRYTIVPGRHASGHSMTNGSSFLSSRTKMGATKSTNMSSQLSFGASSGQSANFDPNSASSWIGLTREATSVHQMLLHLSHSVDHASSATASSSQHKSSFSVVEGRQEDAEEFMTFLLNGINDEMTGCMRMLSSVSATTADPTEPPSADSLDGEEWREVSSSGRSMITRRHTDANLQLSPTAQIFQGQTRSCVSPKSAGGEPTATLQPFFTLQLDIQDHQATTHADEAHAEPIVVASVKDALRANFATETIHGYVCSATGQEVSVQRSMTFECMPPVLILHLKRFIYDGFTGKCRKIVKAIDFGVELEVSRDMISPAKQQRCTKRQRQYRLASVVYHSGSEATKGHYLTDIYFGPSGHWFRCDDSHVKPISEAQLFEHMPNVVPYILLYRRLDTLGQV